MKSKIFVLGLLLAVLSAGGVLVILFNGGSPSPHYRTTKVERGELSVVVSATGTVNAVTVVQVGSQVSGTIARLFADFNSVIRKGQVVAIIDTTFLWASVRDAEANLERAEAQVNKAKRDLERSTPLLERNLLSQADYDAALTAYEQAVAQLKSAEAQFDRAQINLKYATIRSPIEGVVLSRNVDVGQTVAASFSAPTLFTIANDLTKMQVEANIDEADIGRVRAGQSARFTVDAYPEEQFSGRVSQVRLQPQTVENVINYTVIVEVPNPDLDLMPGMTATLFILADERKDVLKVSNMALRFRPPADDPHFSIERPDSLRRQSGGWERQGGEIRQRVELRERREMLIDRPKPTGGQVWILRESRPALVFVRTGISDGTYTEVVHGGLEEGDEVIIGLAQASSTTSSTAPTNPFQPQRIEGGRPRGF